MHIQDLWNKIESRSLPPVLLFGPGKAPFQKEPWEPLLAERALDLIKQAYVEPGMEDMTCNVFYADETSLAEIMAEAETLPFLAERRVIIVRNADRYVSASGDKKSPIASLFTYLENPLETTLILFVTPKIDKRKKFFKACNELGAYVECPQLEDRELGAWIRKEVSAQHKRIQGPAIQEIIQRGGSRLSDIQNALTLVANFVGDAEEIREEDVVAACADVAEESAWTLTDAIAVSDTKKALTTLYELVDLGKSPDEIMGLINWLLESAYRAAPESQATLQSNFVAKKVAPLVKKFGIKKLKAAFALTTETHFMIRSTGVDQLQALELLVMKLAYAPKRPQRRVAG